METLIHSISLLLLLGLILVPIMLLAGIKKRLRLKPDFPVYLVSGLILTAGIICTFAWWDSYSCQLLMNHYGYIFDATNGTGKYQNVDFQNIEKVKQLEIKYFGIGWPLKVMVSYPFYSLYLPIVYLIGQSIRMAKRAVPKG